MAKQPTLDKVNNDILKTKEKIAELQTQLRQLENQKVEIENSEIVGIVRSGNISAEELTAIIEAFRKNKTTEIEETIAKEDMPNES